jgi:hypothetical protein
MARDLYMIWVNVLSTSRGDYLILVGKATDSAVAWQFVSSLVIIITMASCAFLITVCEPSINARNVTIGSL